MADYLLDTTVIIDYLRGNRKTAELLTRLFSEGASLGCCSINIVETYAGLREKERAATENLLSSLEYYDLTPQIARQAGEYLRQYKAKGITLALSDTVIGSIAIVNDLILLTDNSRHYPMPNLKLEVP